MTLTMVVINISVGTEMKQLCNVYGSSRLMQGTLFFETNGQIDVR